MYTGPRAFAAAAIANLALLALHGWAHRVLGVELSIWQATVVYGLIVPGPLVALLLLPRFRGAAALVLLASTFVGLLFGILFHYVLPTADHVAQLPLAPGRGAFRASAAGLAVAEAIGCVVAFGELRHRPPPDSGVPGPS